MKSKATGCGLISTVFSSIVLLCVSSVITRIILTRNDNDNDNKNNNHIIIMIITMIIIIIQMNKGK